ncbi:MAG: capsule assembly Wzi family protein [Spirosomataceae bacterium]
MRKVGNNLFRLFFIFIFLLISIIFSNGQSFFPKAQKYLKTGFIVSTNDKTPFWIQSNQYGTISNKSGIVFFEAGLKSDYDSTFKRSGKLKNFNFGYGIQINANAGNESRLFLTEGYLKARFKFLEFYAGRRKEVLGITDSLLSSGSLIWSGNALPLPKIELYMPNYISIFGKGLISIKWNFAHGWFGNQTYTQKYYLHQKSFYVKLGRRKSFEMGLNNQIQWGGYSEYLKTVSASTVNGYMPSDFNAFINAAFPFPFIRKNFPPKIILINDSMNYGGNVLGSVDLGYNLTINDFKIKIYRQIPYELGSLFSSLVNADDGIYGLSVRTPSKIFNGIGLEGIHTYNQGGYRAGIAQLLNIKDQHFGEIHNYFNHGQYLDGWSYDGFGIGNPLIISNKMVSDQYFEEKDKLYSSFNRVKGINLNLVGKINQFRYRLNYSILKYRPTGSSYRPQNLELMQNFGLIKISKSFNEKRILECEIGGETKGLVKRNLGIKFSFIHYW